MRKAHLPAMRLRAAREDVFSGNGLNFIGEKNYIVTTMECYKAIQPDMRSGRLWEHIRECCPEASYHYGIIVPVPCMTKLEDEYANPTDLEKDITWEMKVIYPCNQGGRKRSTTELLFCMLRSGQ